ncbi:MAG: iron chelate uptake ABC transporter family permease subunit [Treponema sp.]|jgi:iron complex transport system permease protein|nr:iron chelate uptake ABC transporter family permease subunit [Treponema sp.]
MNTYSSEYIHAGRASRLRRWNWVTALLTALCLALCCAMMMLGNTIYPVKDVIRALAGEYVQGASFTVVTLRLPRMLSGLFAGLAFGMAGSVFQTLLRNPLANPNVIGITAGSSAAAAFCILILRASGMFVSLSAVAGGLFAVLIIFIMSRSAVFSVGRLILVGIGVQVMLNAVISYLLLIGAEQDVPAVLRWLSGSLNGMRTGEFIPLMVTVALFAPLLFLLGKQLGLMELGEEAAATLGVDTNKTRLIMMLSSVFLAAVATSTTGPISFVAFLSGPIAKRLAGTGRSLILPSGLTGTVLVLGADLIGQFSFDTRFPVGVITGILGAPYLLFLLIRMNRTGDL